VSSVVADGFTMVAQTRLWNVWAIESEYTQYQSYFTTQALDFLDAMTTQMETDFGFTPTIPAGGSYDGVHFDVILDPASQGGAHTGTVFGSYGVSVSPDSIYNVYSGVTGFWWYILTLHETANVFTGVIAQGWPWADGSILWSGTSPFPGMCEPVILSEIGMTNVATLDYARLASDPLFLLIYNMQKTFGWKLYQGLFSNVQKFAISWYNYTEPLRTATLIFFMSVAAGQNLLPKFNSAGIVVTQAELTSAASAFPSLVLPPLPAITSGISVGAIFVALVVFANLL